MTRRRLVAAGLATAGLAGCFSTPTPPIKTIRPPEVATPAPVLVPSPQGVPDAVPRPEARARHGNPPYYDVYGKRYYVLASSADYVERGVASWYGPGFHEVRTSSGETYDMYAMTAAHKTLPLPAYVRVTNLQNGRSIVVRVNDRGPFVDNRIIDLSYSAAVRLDMLRSGTAMVEVRSIDPASTAPGPGPATPGPLAATPVVGPMIPLPGPSDARSQFAGTAGGAVPHGPLFVQAGAFSDEKNAKRLVAKLRDATYGKIVIRHDVIAGRGMYRVRIGPVADVPKFDRIVAALAQNGVHDAHLALD